MKTVFSNPWFRIIDEDGFYYLTEDRSAVSAAIFAILDNEQLIMIRLKRRPHVGLQLEIPRGYGNLGEDSIDCACRELAEETGYRVPRDRMSLLGQVKPNSAILASTINLYLAQVRASDLTPIRDEEADSIELVPLSHIQERLRAGAIQDAFSLSAIALYQARSR